MFKKLVNQFKHNQLKKDVKKAQGIVDEVDSIKTKPGDMLLAAFTRTVALKNLEKKENALKKFEDSLLQK